MPTGYQGGGWGETRFKWRLCPACKRPEIEQQIKGSPHTNRARLLRFIERHPEGVTSDQCADHIYADDPDGGASGNVISQMVYQLNRDLKKDDLKIHSTRGHGAIYRLFPTNQVPPQIGRRKRRNNAQCSP